jgi:membrane fusion protein (multidrug efflux system)
MNRKKVIAIIAVVLLAGAGVLALLKSHGAADEADDESATPTVVTVQTGALKLTTLHRYVAGFGTVAPASAVADQPAAGAQLAAATTGVVAKVNAIAGQTVAKGDVLVELNSGALMMNNAMQEVARQKELYAQQNTSLKNLQEAEAQLALLQVSSPLSGTVVRMNVSVGQAVDGTTVLAEVMDLNRLEVSAEIPTAEAGQVAVGQTVEIGDEPPVRAAISRVNPTVNKDNDTVTVAAPLPAGGGLRPGQFVPLRIVTEIHTNALAAPAASVVTDQDGKSFVALVKDGAAAQIPVQIGLREDGWVEVTAPELKAGDTVVTVGAYGLPDKSKINVQPAATEETGTNSGDAK